MAKGEKKYIYLKTESATKNCTIRKILYKITLKNNLSSKYAICNVCLKEIL